MVTGAVVVGGCEVTGVVVVGGTGVGVVVEVVGGFEDCDTVGAMTTCRVTVLVWPSWSVTVSFTVYVPAALKEWVVCGVAPASTAVPSPKFQA